MQLVSQRALLFHMERTIVRRASIAAEIRAERARQNISMQQLSDGTGIKIDTLRRRMGGNKPFTTDELDLISHFLAVPLVVLYERAEANND